MMHVPYFYKLFYEYHHYYKSPEPWDDMFIHPIEAFGYYCILYSPPFLFQCHTYAFVAHMMSGFISPLHSYTIVKTMMHIISFMMLIIHFHFHIWTCFKVPIERVTN